MKITNMLSAIGLLVCLPAMGDTVDFSVKVPNADKYQDVRVYVGAGQSVNPEPLALQGNTFQGQVEASPSHFYCISMNDRTRQVSFPVYSTSDKCEITLTSPEMSADRKTGDKINKAIAAYEKYAYDMARRSADELLSMPDEDISKSILSLVNVADSLIKAYKLKGEQADFMRTWGAITAYSTLSTVQFMSRRQHRNLSLDAKSLLPAPESVLDNEMALWFYDTPNIVMTSIGGGTAEERLATLYDKYSNPAIRDKVKLMIANQFITGHDYVNQFDEGRKRLEDMIDSYGLPAHLLVAYDSRRASIPGTAFPEDVVLRDADGNEVSFAKFRGKYVYVDMWASWCVPCCKEVPSLQALEKDLGRDDVEFLSISIDSDKDAWLKRMQDLNMHGNQVHDSEGKIAEKLNIKSIPHFLLYGPDGNLIEYKTSRPSHTSTREMLLALPKVE